MDLKVAVVHSLGNVRRIMKRIKSGEVFHFVEVMTCPGGCIGGGGQPRYTDDAVRLKRIDAIYKEDEGKKIRKSHENPFVQQIYKEYFDYPNSEKAHHFLHTCYTPRDKV